MITELSEITRMQATAYAFMQNQLFREAIVVLSDLLEFQAKNEQLWIDLAACYQSIKRCDLAQKALEKGARHNPDSINLSFALVRLFLDQGNTDRALEIMSLYEKDLITDLALAAAYCDLLWDSGGIATLQAVLSRWAGEIGKELFFVDYQIKIFLMQQRAEDAAGLLADYLEINPVTNRFVDLFAEIYSQLFPYKFPWIYEYEPALVNRLKNIAASLSQSDDVSPGIVITTIQLALAAKEFDEALQVIERARKVDWFRDTESTRSAIEYFADLCNLMVIDYGERNNKPLSLIDNQPGDVDSILASFLYHWKIGTQEKWLSDARDLILISEKDEAPILWCLRFLRDETYLDEALKVAEMWQKQYPHSIQATTQAVTIMVDLERISESIAGIQEILAREEYIPDDIKTLLFKISLKLQDFTLVEQIVTPEFDIGELSLTESVDYYRLLMANEKFEKAIELCNISEATNEAEHTLLCNFLCDAYYFSGNLADAFDRVSALTKSFRLHNDSSFPEEYPTEFDNELPEELLFHTTPMSVYLRLAILYRVSGDLLHYGSYIERAYNLSPDNPICQYALLMLQNTRPGWDLKANINGLPTLALEDSVDRYGKACRIFEELLLPELGVGPNPLRELVANNSINVQSAKLSYELLTPSEKFITLCPPNIQKFSCQIMEEIGFGDRWHPDLGENSIFFAFAKDDLWFLREKELSHFLPIRLKLTHRYLEQHPASNVAKAAQFDAMIRAYFWQIFLGELGIEEKGSSQIDPENITALFDQIQHDLIGNETNQLWEWFTAIRANHVILVDTSSLDQFSDAFFAYYLVAVRKTVTKVSVQSLVDRAGSRNHFLLLQLAYSMMTVGANDKALVITKSFATELPEDPILHCVLARVYEANHMLTEAISHLDIALRHDPQATDWHEWMAGWAYEYEDSRLAVKHLEVLLTRKEDNTDVAVLLTHSYLKQGSINKAKKLLDQLIKRGDQIKTGGSDDIEALKVLYFAQKKNLDICLRYLIDMPCNSPLLRDAYLAVVNLAVEEQSNDLAMRLIQRAYAYQPNYHTTLITLAKVLISLHHFDDARKILDQVDITINPSACYEKLQLLEIIVDEEKFFEQLKLAYQLFPQHPGIIYRFAEYLAKRGQEQKASVLLGTLFAYINPTTKQLVFAGKLHLKLGNLDKAISYMSEVIEKQPNDSLAYLSLASAYIRQRQYAAAMDVYQRAIAHKPADYKAYYHAGIMLRDLKRYQEAETFLSQAVDLAPKNWEIRNQLGAVMALNFIEQQH